MRVLFVTSEVAGLYKLGGLGDVSRALPKALHKLGVNISVVVPYYKDIKLPKPKCLGSLAVDFDGKRELVFVFATTLPGTQVPLVLLRHPKLNDYHKEDITATFAFYAKAVAVLVGRAKALLGGDIDIVHCNDWHTSLVPLLLGETSTKTILTIHNLLYQGTTNGRIAKQLGVPQSVFHVLERKEGSIINFLREGIIYTDTLTTVSPTYAHEICTGHYGEGLGDVLRRRKKNLVGILNGIDTQRWNPDTDSSLPVRFSMSRVAPAKKKLKALLQKEVGLPQSPGSLLVGFIGRLEMRQKGVDIMVGAVKSLLPSVPFQLVILGKGEPRVVKKVRALEKAFDHNISYSNTFNDPLARRIYGGCDLLLVPSKFEPSGLTQMIAMRYGTIPLVRKTGGLRDSVKDGKTGFVFTAYTKTSLSEKLKQAIATYEIKPTVWQTMIANAMKEDFSWEKSGQKYKALYAKLYRS